MSDNIFKNLKGYLAILGVVNDDDSINVAKSIIEKEVTFEGGNAVRASEEKIQRRLSICRNCPYLGTTKFGGVTWNDSCIKCGCPTSVKAQMEVLSTGEKVVCGNYEVGGEDFWGEN